MSLDCPPGTAIALLSARFSPAGSGPLHCPLPARLLAAATRNTADQAAAGMKACRSVLNASLHCILL